MTDKSTTWQPLIGSNVIRGWLVTASSAGEAKDAIEAAMEKKGVWGAKINWINGGRKVEPVQEPLKAEVSNERQIRDGKVDGQEGPNRKEFGQGRRVSLS